MVLEILCELCTARSVRSAYNDFVSGASSLFIAAEGVRRAHGWLDLWMGLMLAGGGRWRGCELLSRSGVPMFSEGDVSNAEIDVMTRQCRVRIAGIEGGEEREARVLAEALEEAAARFSRIDPHGELWRLADCLDEDLVRTAVIDDQMRYVCVNEQLARWHGEDIGDHTGRTMREVIGVMAEAVEPVVREVLRKGGSRQVLFSGGITGETGRAYVARYSPIVLGPKVLCRAEVWSWMWRGCARDAQAAAVATACGMHQQGHVSQAVRWELADGSFEVKTESVVLRRAVREALRSCAQARTCVVRSRVVGGDLAMVFRADVIDAREITTEAKARVTAGGGAVFVADDVQIRFPLKKQRSGVL